MTSRRFLATLRERRQMNVKKKGNAGERELLHLLEAHGIPAHRNDQRFVGGLERPDIAAEVCGLPVHLEVKRQEHLRLSAAVSQAVHDANGNALPIVAHRSNRQPWLVTARLADLLQLLDDMETR